MSITHIGIDILLLLVAAPALMACAYLLVLTLLSQKPAPMLQSSRSMCFDIVIPAHDEATGIQRVVANLQKVDWPTDQYRIVVIADNCTDATATLAREAGAEVLERHNATLRGKGYALELAFQQSMTRGWADAVVVVDADSEVTANFLEAFASRIESGAGVVQAHYGVLNPNLSWRTRLMTIALAAFHIVRSRARERLKLSCGIRGNGWCITHRLLKLVPYRSFSLAEDIEYGLAIGLAGYRVYYADEATVRGEMVASKTAAAQQRQRWESGRSQLIRTNFLPLLAAIFKRRSKIAVDLLMDLMVLPLSYIALNTISLIALAGIAIFMVPGSQIWLWLGFFCCACIAAYVLRGWQLSGVGKRGLIDLLHAPGFIFWKTLLVVRSRAPVEWVRTKRESL